MINIYILWLSTAWIANDVVVGGDDDDDDEEVAMSFLWSKYTDSHSVTDINK